MTKSPRLHIHLIAICGTGMGALAVMLKSQGHYVTGSDKDIYPPMSTVLKEQDIPVFQGFNANHLDPKPDLVVIGNAISRGNPEAEAVLSQNIKYASMPEVLKTFFLWDKTSIVITGTHGKTTTTSMLAWVMENAGLAPSYIIGGLPVGWETGAKLGTGDVFILEGDEYDSAFFDKRAKFLNYLPDIVIINNIEFDHADIYNNIEEIKVAFRRLVNIIPGNGLLIGSADDEHIPGLLENAFCPVQTFGITHEAGLRACEINITPAGTTFDLFLDGVYHDGVTIPIYGHHNVQNALAVIAAATQVGVPWNEIKVGLKSFPGIKRRLEVRGVINDIRVYDDFAHHPTAVKATLTALRSAYPNGKIWAIFEPRTATTIRRVFQESYASAFDEADHILLAPVFLPQKAPPGDRFSIDELIRDLKARNLEARAYPDLISIVDYLGESVEPGDHLVFMSNGSFGGIHDLMLKRLRHEDDA